MIAKKQVARMALAMAARFVLITLVTACTDEPPAKGSGNNNLNTVPYDWQELMNFDGLTQIGTASAGGQTIDIIGVGAGLAHIQRCGILQQAIKPLYTAFDSSLSDNDIAAQINLSIRTLKPQRPDDTAAETAAGGTNRALIDLIRQGQGPGGTYPADIAGMHFEDAPAEVAANITVFSPAVDNTRKLGTPGNLGAYVPGIRTGYVLLGCGVGCFREREPMAVTGEGKALPGDSLSSEDLDDEVKFEKKPIAQVEREWRSGSEVLAPALAADSLFEQNSDKPELKLVATKIRSFLADSKPENQEVVEVFYEVSDKSGEKRAASLVVTASHPVLVRRPNEVGADGQRRPTMALYRAENLKALFKKDPSLQVVHRSGSYASVKRVEERKEVTQAFHYVVRQENGALPLVTTGDLVTGDRSVQAGETGSLAYIFKAYQDYNQLAGEMVSGK